MPDDFNFQLFVSKDTTTPQSGDAGQATTDSVEPVLVGSGKNVVVIDTSVEGYEDLAANVAAGTDVVLIDGTEGGIASLANALAAYSNIASLQIISHGATGELVLGQDILSLDTLDDHSEALGQIGEALANGADLMLFGCHIGDGGEGRDFLEALATATGADVAASDDLTGSAANGADWDLEVKTGDIEAEIAVSETALQDFSHVLAVPGTMDLATAGTVGSYNGGAATVNATVLDSDYTLVFDGSLLSTGHLAGSVYTSDGESQVALSFDGGYTFTTTSISLTNVQGSSETFTVTSNLGDTVTTASISNLGSTTVDLSNFSANITTLYITPSDGSMYMSVDSLVVTSISAAASNQAPVLGADVVSDTATEDVATAIDLSGYDISDPDGNSPLTLTLAVDKGTIASVDGNGTFGGVTVTTSGTTSMTLQGSEADLNTYLNDTSHITFTTDNNDTSTATLTVTPNDGTDDGTADTVSISITAVNDDPTATGLPTDITVTEDTEGDIDLSSATFADVDSDTLTITLTISGGTFSTPANGEFVGLGVTETLVNSTTIELVGTAADLNTYLTSGSAIKYTGAENINGNDAATLTVTADDDDGSGNVTLATINLDITAVNDPITATGAPTDITVTEDAESNVDLSGVDFSDVDENGDSIITLTASEGTFTANSGGGVTVGASGSGTITLSGSLANIEAFLDDASAIQYTGAADDAGDNAATFTVSANDDDGSGDVDLFTTNLDITDVNDRPELSGVDDLSVTEGDAATIIDSNVTFTDLEQNFDGGTVTVTGVLAEDVISVNNEGTGAGQIGLDGTTVTYGGTTIGTVSGGSGTNFTVTLNGNADNAGVRALIQNLTYTNTSDTPTATHTINVDVTDAAGDSVVTSGGDPVFTAQSGAGDLMAGLNLVSNPTVTFADIDNDGDLDLFTGSDDTFIRYFENTGTTTNPTFTERFNNDNPLDNADGGENATHMAFGDLDNDGDLDLVIGGYDGELDYYENTGTASAATFTARSGGDNPFNLVDLGYLTRPEFVDIDNDGDLDLFVGTYDQGIEFFRNDGNANNASFSQITGASNPLDSAASGLGNYTSLGFILNDGVYDAFVSGGTGGTAHFRNDGTAESPTFAEESNTDNLFEGNLPPFRPTTEFADLDGDGVVDVVTVRSSTVTYHSGSFPNTNGDDVIVTVSPVNDAPAFTGLDGTPTFTEDGTAVTLDGNVTVSDVELDASNSGSGDYSGASVTIVRNGGANAVDSFAVPTGGSLTVAGSNISAGGDVIATIDTSTAGQIVITFADNGTTPTTALVNEVLQAITYENSSDNPDASVQLDWTFSDGNSGNAQGSGDNPATVTGSTTVSITPVNENPTLTATGEDPSFIEDGNVADLFSGADIDVGDTGQAVTGLTLTVTNVTDGSDEILNIDGTQVSLTDANSVTTSGNSFDVDVSVSGSTATVVLSGGSVADTAMESIINAISYQNDSDTLTEATRTVTLTTITDEGSDNNSTSGLTITSDVSVSERTDIIVTSNSDVVDANDGVLTLREAIAQAELDDAADTIVFDASLSGDTITLNGAELAISTDITIDGDVNGDDAADITISANSLSRVFHFTDGTSTLQSLTISDGATAGASSGAGVLIEGANTDVTIDSTTISDNSSGHRGGGIYVDDLANMTLTDSLVTGNDAVFGSVVVIGTATIDNTTIAHNSASSGIAGLHVYGSGTGNAVVDASNLTITGNDAPSFSQVLTENAGSLATLNLSDSIVASTGGGGDNILNASVMNFSGTVVVNEAITPTSGSATLETNLANIFNSTTVNGSATGGTLADNGQVVQTVLSTGTAADVGAFPNTAPSFTGLDGTPSFTEGGTAVTLDGNVTVSDIELDALNNGNGYYSNATLTIARNGGANANDSFSFDTSGNTFVTSGTASSGAINTFVDDDSFATYTVSGGTLTISFTSAATAATTALVNDVLQHIQYENSSDNPDANVQLDWTFSDGTDTGTGSTTVSITGVNDEPTLTATAVNPTYTEDGTAQDLFSTPAASTVEAGQTISGLTLTVTNVSDTGDEILNIDGSAITLDDSETGMTATNSLNYSVAVSNGTATITITGGTMSATATQTLVDGISYQNNSDDPSTGANRVVTITSLTDSGGTANSGDDTAALSVASTVSINAVNDAPVITGVHGDSSDIVVAGGAQEVSLFSDVTITNADSDDFENGFLTIAQNTGTANGSWSVDGATVTSGGNATVGANQTVQVSGVTIGTIHATDDGQSGNDLRITFTANATAERIETFLQNLRFNGPSVIDARTFTLTLNDADGTASNGDEDTTADFTINMEANPPVIGNLDGDSFTFTEGDNATDLDVGSNVTLTDGDSANFDGGNVTITVIVGRTADDRLVLDTGTVTLSAGQTAGSTVTVDSVVIGTINAGSTGGSNESLVITFNDNATPARVQELLGAIQFDNASDDAPIDGNRIISVTVTDASGVNAASDSVNITVNVDPVNDVAVFSGDLTGTMNEDADTLGGDLDVTDPDTDEAHVGDDPINGMSVSGTYGNLDIDESGDWVYDLDEGNATVQALGAGDTLGDTLTINSVDGTEQDITITITGVNDDPTFGGDLTAALNEDTDTVGGTATVADIDTDEDVFTAETLTGTYGELTIDANGDWVYDLNETLEGVQSLRAGGRLSDTLTVESDDGTEQDITITIDGVNDAAVFSGDLTGTMNEDADTLSGDLDVADVDTNQAYIGDDPINGMSVSGTYGNLDIDVNGDWVYDLDEGNATVQALGAGDTLGDTLTIETIDGTEQDIIITITGENDAATFGGDLTATLNEDTDTVGGTATVADVDTGEDVFTAETLAGTYGELTIDANGDWVYDLNETLEGVQGLDAGDTLGDTFTVESDDGTEQDITITIDGVNDAPTADPGRAIAGEKTGYTFSAADFNFSDADTGDTLTSVILDTVPSRGTFQLSGVDVTAGQVIAVADIGNLTYMPVPDNDDNVKFTFRVNDGTEYSAGATFTLEINGVNDAPTNIRLDSDGVAEEFGGAFVGTLSARDPEGDAVTFSSEDSRFHVVGNNLYLKNGLTLDYETESSLTIQVRATDSGGVYTKAFVTFDVLDREEVDMGGGTDGNDMVTGTSNDDIIVGGAGDDVLDGGEGNDRIIKDDDDEGQDIIVGGSGDDTIEAGGGNDFVIGGGATDGTNQQSLDRNSDPNSDNSDTIRGGSGDDTILGGGWNDDLIDDNGSFDEGEEVESGTAPDQIWAGSGSDMAIGSGGDDKIGGNTDEDTIRGGNGDDTIFGNVGDDIIFGEGGDDLLFNGTDDDTVDGGDGDDTLWAGAGDDLLTGGDGADSFIFTADSGNDTVADFSLAEDNLDFTMSSLTSLDAVLAAASEDTQSGIAGVLIDLGGDNSAFLVGLTLEDLGNAQILV